MRSVLLFVLLSAACGGAGATPESIEVLARGDTRIFLDQGSGWVALPIDDGSARFEIDGPYALVSRCTSTESVRMLLAAPGDASRWFLDCPTIWGHRTTITSPVGTFVDLSVGAESTAVGTSGAITMPSGTFDVFAFDLESPRVEIQRAVTIDSDGIIDVDVARRGLALEQRPYTVRDRPAGVGASVEWSLATSRGTIVRHTDMSVIPTDQLEDDDLLWATAQVVPREGTAAFASVDLRSIADGAEIDLDLDLGESTANVTAGRDLVVAWQPAGDWDRVTVDFVYSSWVLEAYAGWLAANEVVDELHAPEPPLWGLPDPTRAAVTLTRHDERGAHGLIVGYPGWRSLGFDGTP